MTKTIEAMVEQKLIGNEYCGRSHLIKPWDEALAPLVGQEIVGVVDRQDKGVFIKFADGTYLMFYHDQDCCEEVWLEEAVGLEDLVGQHYVRLTETCEETRNEYDELSGWTFYNLATLEGHATLRFCGASNGYYSIVTGVYIATEEALEDD